MSFSYSRYGEIVEKLNSLTKVLSEANEDNYMSFKVQDTLCRVIKEANRVNTYIRHHKKWGGVIVDRNQRKELDKRLDNLIENSMTIEDVKKRVNEGICQYGGISA